MDGESLSQWLEQGLSLEEIGRRVGKDASTVGYWVAKHGLEAAHRSRHCARGGLSRGQLEPLVAEGLSQREIAARLDRSQSTIRYWLRQYGLVSKGRPGAPLAGGREARAAGLRRFLAACPVHGKTEFILEGRGYYRCCRCRQEAVVRRRRKLKRILVEEAGGRCCICGYATCVGALHFHHVDPSSKAFDFASRGMTRSIAILRQEAGKCVLLCSNCHAEVEAGVRQLPA